VNTGPRSYLVGYGKGTNKPWPELIEGPSRKAVLREVARAVEAGELAASGPLEQAGGGRYQVAVWRIRERHVSRRWVRPVAIASGAVTAVGGLTAAAWWAATTTATAVGLPVLAVLAALGWLVYAAMSRDRGGGCETTGTIRHRHH
jgi:hypothetical protein